MTESTTTEPTAPVSPDGAVTIYALRTTEFRRIVHDLPEPREWQRTGLFYPAMAQRLVVDARRDHVPGVAEPAWNITAVMVIGGNYRNWAERTGGITRHTVATRYPATAYRHDPPIEGLRRNILASAVTMASDRWAHLPEWVTPIASGMVALLGDG